MGQLRLVLELNKLQTGRPKPIVVVVAGWSENTVKLRWPNGSEAWESPDNFEVLA